MLRPPTPSSAMPPNMNTGNHSHRDASSALPSSHLPFQPYIDGIRNVYRPTYHPEEHSFLGPLPPSSDQAIHDFDTWNHSARGCFPSQTLCGPGHTGPSDNNHPPPPNPHKRKRAASPDPAEVGGYGPIPGSPSEQTERSTPDPPPAIGYTGRKNTAYDIWMFTRAAETNKEVTANDWSDDYGDHLTKRPGTTFVGCKFCTQFG